MADKEVIAKLKQKYHDFASEIVVKFNIYACFRYFFEGYEYDSFGKLAMIHYNSSEQTNNTFLRAFSDLELSSTLRQCGIRKSKCIPVIEVFRFLVLSVFQGKNLYRFLDSDRMLCILLMYAS